MSRLAGEMLKDIEKEPFRSVPNFDNTKQEPDCFARCRAKSSLNGTLGNRRRYGFQYPAAQFTAKSAKHQYI